MQKLKRSRLENNSLAGIKVDEPIKGLLHLKFPNQQLLAWTFLRFQEHYESPEFKGKIFTISQFIDWYIKWKGKFDYLDEWDGFNLPIDALKPFIEGKFDPLSAEEKAFIEIVQQRKEIKTIIGTVIGGDPDVLKHELAHALYFLSENYRKEVLKIIKNADVDEITKHLIEVLGYHSDREILDDELHAYLLSEWTYLEDKAGIEMEKYAKTHAELNSIFRTHFPALEHFPRGK